MDKGKITGDLLSRFVNDNSAGEEILCEAYLLRTFTASSLVERYELLQKLYAMLKRRQVPLVVANRVYFLYWGSAQSVSVIGDWSSWNTAEPMMRIPGSNMFVLLKFFPETAAVQYKFIVDGRWILDPLNSSFSLEGFGMNSEILMPKFPIPEILSCTQILEGGDLELVHKHDFWSDILEEERTIFFYRPLKRRRKKVSMVLVFHDGYESLTLGGYARLLEKLQQQGTLPPVAAVFLPPKRRNWEYMANEQFERFCIEEVLPQFRQWCDQQHLLLPDSPDRYCVVGASLAGLLATRLALLYPDILGSFIAQSPAYWAVFEQLWSSDQIRNARAVAGVLQTGTIADARVPTLLMYHRFREFTSRIAYQETHQGHTWGQWRRMLLPGILQLLRFLE